MPSTPLQKRERRLLIEHGLTVALYDAMLIAQGGCALCAAYHPFMPVWSGEDETGRPRAERILCRSCFALEDRRVYGEAGPRSPA